MSPEYYVKLLYRYWRAIALGLVLGLLAGLGLGLIQPKVYTANSSGFLNSTVEAATGSTNSVAIASASDSYAKSRAKSYADLGQSRVVAESVIEKLGLDTSPQSLVGSVTVSAPTDTVTIQVSAKASTPQGASDIANAWIEAMAEEIRSLETGGSDSLNATLQLTPLESAVIPSRPSSPNLMLFASTGALIGLLGAVVFALFKGQYDKRIRSTSDVEAVTDHPIVGKLPLEKSLTEHESRLSLDGKATEDVRVRGSVQLLNESLRDLRTNLEFLDVDNPPRSIVVTSALPGDGKSTVAANLATIIASSGKQVVLIDADLRKPTVATSFNLPSEVGLTDVLAGRAPLASVVHQWDPRREMYILTAGSIPPNPAELLASNTMKELVNSLTAEGATVIIDAPPVLPVTDASILAAQFDGALVVASANVTRTDSLEQALNKIESVQGRVLGMVLNRIPTKGFDRHSYGYYGNSYYYQSDEESQGGSKSAPESRRSHRAMEAKHSK